MSEENVQHKTCLVTVVEPGLPDRVIKIYPANHESEKIWLDTRPGIERWEAVKLFMRNHCPKGKYVPDASYWHQPGAPREDINTPILTPDKIPVVHVEGAVFEAPPPKERVKYPNPLAMEQSKQQAMDDTKRQIEQLQQMVVSLAARVVAQPAVAVAAAPSPEAAPKRGRGRPKKQQEEEKA
jgi:hypothetical protein